MKHRPRFLDSLARHVLAGLVLAASTHLGLGATALVNDFNTADDIAGWGVNYGVGSIAWDASAGTDATGCLKLTLSAADSNAQLGPLCTLGAMAFNSADYVLIEYDMMVDPTSGTDVDGSYGNWQEVLRDANWSWDSHWVGALGSGHTYWTHMTLVVPNNAKNYPMLGFELKTGAPPYTADVVVYIDNLVIQPFVNPLVVGAFASADEVANWTYGGLASLSWSETDAGNDTPPGSLAIDVAYNTENTGWQEGTAFYNLSFTPPRYTYAAFDLFVDNPNGLTSFGIVQLFLNYQGWVFVGSVSVNADYVGKWTHVEMPLPAAATAATGFIFQFGGGMTAPLQYRLDNVEVYKPEAPPSIKLAKAGPSGVEITMDDDGAQWQREAIATPSDAAASAFFWVAQAEYPVSYSFTIADFPDRVAHPGFEAHMYIVNGDTVGGTWNQTYGGVDWNASDIFIFRVENGADNVVASIQWKTNLPAANPPADAIYHPVTVTAPSAIGTWTVTFTSMTTGTLTGPGVAATAFEIPEEAALHSFSPATSFIQFGMFKNDGANDGHNNQAHGTFSKVEFTGSTFPFSDTFNGASLTANYAWRVTRTSSVTFVPPGTGWWVNWTLPADGFGVVLAPEVTGPWADAGVTYTFQRGAVMFGGVPTDKLPAGNKAFFQLSRPQ